MMGALFYCIPDEYLTLLKAYLVPAIVMVVCTVAPPAIIAAAGFSTAGVVGGSLAAKLQSSLGNVGTKSAFATLQYAGTAPLLTAGIGAGVGAGGLAVGYGVVAVLTAVSAFSVIQATAFAFILLFCVFLFLRRRTSTS
jgi:hypothetical protein